MTWTALQRTLAANIPTRETTGEGCAFLDYDNDGGMDIYMRQ